MKRMRFMIPVFYLAAIAVLSAVVMLLWNLLFPAIFGLIAISYWQALGLLVLARILLGGFGRNRMRDMLFHGHSNPIHEKWRGMSPEQRIEFINKRRHFGHRHPFGSGYFEGKDSGHRNEHE